MINEIEEYENGYLDFEQTIKLFARLIETDEISHLQGSYQRTAVHFMNKGWILHDGTIEWDVLQCDIEEAEYDALLRREKDLARCRY